MLDRAEAAQITDIVAVDMPVVDVVAALPQEIADHVLARPRGAAGRGNRHKIPCGRKLRVETGIDGIEDFPLGIANIHRVIVPILCRIAKTAPARSNHTLPGIAEALESVREHQVGLQSFRSMSRIEARRKKASALRLRFSQSFASLRQRLSHAMVRSTIQRLGNTANPLT